MGRISNYLGKAKQNVKETYNKEKQIRNEEKAAYQKANREARIKRATEKGTKAGQTTKTQRILNAADNFTKNMEKQHNNPFFETTNSSTPKKQVVQPKRRRNNQTIIIINNKKTTTKPKRKKQDPWSAYTF
jgi:hypothetical protein